jgi:hypothetical protein
MGTYCRVGGEFVWYGGTGLISLPNVNPHRGRLAVLVEVVSAADNRTVRSNR